MKLTTTAAFLRAIAGNLFTNATVTVNGRRKVLWYYKATWQEGPNIRNTKLDLTGQGAKTIFYPIQEHLLVSHNYCMTMELIQNMPYPINEIVWLAERAEKGILITYWLKDEQSWQNKEGYRLVLPGTKK